MATAPILPDRPPATVLSIVSRLEVIPVDDHAGYFYVTDTATHPGRTYIATSLDCNCADYTAGRHPCQHMTAVKRETAALCAYAADWDRMATQHLATMVYETARATGRRRRGRRAGRRWRSRQIPRSAAPARDSVVPPGEPPFPAADHDHEAMDAAIERHELEEVAQDLLGLLVFTAQHRVLEAAAPIPWKVGVALITDPDAALRRLALTLALGPRVAIEQDPE